MSNSEEEITSVREVLLIAAVVFVFGYLVVKIF
jgi:hypothetical protein